MSKAKRFLSMWLTVCMLLGLFPSTAYAASNAHPFTDVNESDWFSDAVQYVYENGLMNGTDTTIFDPQSSITRGQIVTILYRLEGTPSSTGASFTDVPVGQWYTDAVAWASANGIMGGYGNGLFGPADSITREQMATAMYHYSTYKEYDTAITGSIAAFSDGNTVSAYAVDALNWAIGAGLMNGMDNNMLAPKDGSTRAQAATILMRVCENTVPSSKGTTPGEDTTPSENTTSSRDITPTVEYHTVTFDYNYGSKGTYNTVTVEHGKTVASPPNPSRSRYTFNHWYTAASGGSKFDFSTVVTSDLTLYAHWTARSSGSSSSGGSYVPSPSPSNTYTVTFDSNGGSAVASQAVISGEQTTRPADPTKGGYRFVGWYSDSALTTVYNFNNAVTANITLYARWEEIAEEEDSYLDAPNPEVEIYSFDLDTRSIPTNESKLVTFTAEIFAELELEVNDVYIVSDNNTNIGYMHDDGQNGDIVENDHLEENQRPRKNPCKRQTVTV